MLTLGSLEELKKELAEKLRDRKTKGENKMLLHEIIMNFLETNKNKVFMKNHTFTAPVEEEEQRKKPETVEGMEKLIVETVDRIISANRTAFISGVLDDIQKPGDVVKHTHNLLTAFMVRTLGWEEKKAKKYILETAGKKPDMAELFVTALLKANVAERKKE